MKLLFDLFPVALFVIAYFLSDIFVATGILILATVIQVVWLKIRDGVVPRIHLVTLGLLLFFGGLTIALQDPLFIKWKPTIVNWLFAAGFLVAPLFGGKTLPERMMGSNIALETEQWKRLNLAWVLFFLLLGILNLAVAFNFSEAVWVNFKLFGLMGLTVLFALGQGLYIVRHTQEPVD
ncbi:MAG: septation protein A [Sedimenticolaceae bacterium]|nr:septation protein A [Sedimenticolaceae bacterium]